MAETTPSVGSRRIPRLAISMRTLMATTLILVLAFSWVAGQRQQSMWEVQQARRIGGTFKTSGYFDDPSSPRYDQPTWRRTAGELFGPRVRQIHLRSPSQDFDLHELDGFSGIRELWLQLSSSDKNQLAPLSQHGDLRRLQLQCDHDLDLTPIAQLGELESLFLDAPISDLSPLARISSLRVLVLRRIVTSDVSGVTNLDQLQTLVLRQSPVQDIAPVAGLTRLLFLHIDDTSVSDLSPLHSLSGLKEFTARGIPATEDEKSALRKALPNCSVSF